MSYSRTSHLIFLLLISIAAIASNTNAQTVSFSRTDRDLSIDNPAQIVTADFNKDGNLDLAFSDKFVPQVFVVLGDGHGAFGPEMSFPTVGPATSIVTADFNRDGNPDLAMAVPSQNSIVILFGAGNGTFGAPLELHAGPSPFQAPLGVVAGDFDGDGIPDLMSIAVGSNVVSFIKGNGDGTFGPYTFAGTVRDDPLMILAADFNLDGILDIATANFDFFGITVALGIGNGTLKSPFEMGTSSGGAVALTTGDFNQDTFPDLAFVHRFPQLPGTVSLVLGNGDGTFGPARSDATPGLDPRSIVTADFNLDGDLDVAVANLVSNTVSILPGTNDLFQIGSPQNLLSFSNPIALATGDFNNDCRPDLAVLNAGNGTLSILLNTTPKAPLQIVDVLLSKDVLWPPNHKLMDVTVDYSTTNTCGPVMCSLSVTSNEPVSGSGDNTAPDWEIIDEHHVRLRAERASNGSGRVYTITITCSDGSGNPVSTSATVTVPKNQRQ
ncbi:MAG TPA: VCBS repeat-containing protein [Pyrinomonadaceae bacterium]